MSTVYLICLVVGGGVAILSAFGDFLDFDVDTDVDLDIDLDLDADVGDALEVGTDTAPSAAIFSLRALVFALFGFGATGTVLVAFGARSNSLSTVGLSGAAGLSVGLAVGSILSFLKRSDTRSRPGDEGFRGLTGRVTLPIRETAPGQVVIRRGLREHAVRALPHASANTAPDDWTRVVVVEMRDGIAYVGPLGDDEALLT